MKNSLFTLILLVSTVFIQAQNFEYQNKNKKTKQQKEYTNHESAKEGHSAVSLTLFSNQRALNKQNIEQHLYFFEQRSKVKLFSEVSINNAFRSKHILSPADVIFLNINDYIHEASITRVTEDINGTITVIARFDEPSGYFTISTSGNRSFGSIFIPEAGSYYKILSAPLTSKHYIVEMDASDRDILQAAPPLIPEISEQDILEQARIHEKLRESKQGPLDPATIDVMIVYTPAAAAWAAGSGSGDIANIVAQSMANAQLVLDNSETFITMNLAHSAEVDYSESGSSLIDLIRFTASPDYNPWGNYQNGYYIPGHMDEIHEWRNQYGADLSALFALVEDTGGIAWLLNNMYGLPNRGFSLTRVQQAATGYTHIHEMGHNMGLHHHKDQNVQPGPTVWWNWPENNWSAGWRWTGTDNGHYCSVMTYASGIYFDDGINHTEVPYFSNPDITHAGVPAGHPADGDNARTLREIKHVIAAYRSLPLPEVFTAETTNITSNSATSGGTVTNDGGLPLSARGVVWAAYENPDIDNNEGFTVDGNSLGSFTSQITGLSPSTNYFVRAYATNDAGTAYGDLKTFTTLSEATSYPVTFNVNNQSGQPIPGAMITVYPERTHPTKHNAKLMTKCLDPGESKKTQHSTGDPGMLSVVQNAGAVFNQSGFGKDGEWIQWCDDESTSSIGTNAPAVFSVASRWLTDDLADYDEWNITQLSFVPAYENAIYTLYIWVGSNMNPTPVYSQVVSNPEIDEWNIIELDSPFTISAADGVWFGYEIDTQGGYPAGCDSGPQVPGKGNMILFGSTEWVELTDLNNALTYNWSIQAYVVPGEDQPDPEPIVIYTNAAGQASFDAMPGAYSYVVEKDGYYDVGNQFNVTNAPVTINVVMEEIPDDDSYPVTFNVNNQSGQPIPGAMITVYPGRDSTTETSPMLMKRGNTAPGSDEIVPTGQLNNAARFDAPGGAHLLQLAGNTIAGTLPPASDVEKSGEWIKYWESGVNDSALGLGGDGADWYAAIRWIPEDLVAYQGHEVTKIRVFINDEPDHGSVIIWQGNINEPAIMVSQSMMVTSEDWVEVELFDPYLIDTSQELWIGWEMGDPGDGVFPAAFETSTQHDQLANLLQFGDNPWNFASAFGFDVVWNIEAYVEPLEVDPIILFTDTDGNASFEAMPGYYTYTVEKEGYSPADSEFTVIDEAMSINVTMVPLDPGEYTITFNIVDEFEDPVYDAVITMGGITNPAGDYIFEDVPHGMHSYTVTRLCYHSTSGEILINQEDIFTIMLYLNITPGDANGDGIVNILDIITVSNFWGTQIPPNNWCFHNADINSDGAINILDIIGISNIWAGGN